MVFGRRMFRMFTVTTRGVGAGNAHARGLAGFGDDGGFGKGFTGDRHLLAGPPSWRIVGRAGVSVRSYGSSSNHIGT
jgi:hypothetical protein